MFGDRCCRYREKQSKALNTKHMTMYMKETAGSQCYCLKSIVSDKITKHFGSLIWEMCGLICCRRVAVGPGYILSARTGSYGVITLLSLDTGGGTVYPCLNMVYLFVDSTKEALAHLRSGSGWDGGKVGE